jgi:Na+/serine symporter
MTIPDNLAQEARAAGLLTPQALEAILRETLRKQRVDELFNRAPIGVLAWCESMSFALPILRSCLRRGRLDYRQTVRTVEPVVLRACRSVCAMAACSSG